jgi:D-amino-acid dehydrogenase
MGKNIVIVGGGIVGLSCAYYLQKEGHQVTVFDKSNMSAGASYVNAGYITPSHIVPMAAPGMISTGIKYMFNTASPFYMKPRLDIDFLKWAWYFKKSSTAAKVEKAIPVIKDINILSRQLFQEIKDSGDLGNFHLERKGLLMLYQTQKECDHEMAVAAKAKFLGLEVNQLDMTEIKKLEPNIQINALGAIHYECDAHMTPSDFMTRMKTFLQGAGVKLKHNEEVIDIKLISDKLVKVKTSKGELKADAIVLAAGSWTSKLSKQLHISLPLQAGKGYRINVKRKTGICMPAILMESKMAVTPMKGFTRFAGTMEFSGINNKIRKERVDAIAKGASKYYEGLQITKEEKNDVRCGLRPVSPDGLPYIGAADQHHAIVFATGHAMMGWSLGPATGKLVSELITKRKTSLDLLPFHPQRRF